MRTPHDTLYSQYGRLDLSGNKLVLPASVEGYHREIHYSRIVVRHSSLLGKLGKIKRSVDRGRRDRKR